MRFRLKWWFLILVVVCLLIFGIRSCRHQAPQRNASTGGTEPKTDSPLISPAPGPPLAVNRPPTPNDVVPVIASGQQGMLSVSFAFDAAGRLVVRSRDEVPEAKVRPLRKLDGQRGLYHRIVGAGGEQLFENVEPDPRQVHWDTTDDGKKLRGGVVTLPDEPLVLRLPAGIRGRLEVFLINNGNWTPLAPTEQATLVGSFDLQ